MPRLAEYAVRRPRRLAAYAFNMLRVCVVAALAAHAAAASAFSPFSVAKSFSEHAVLQAAPATARVWGWTVPGGVVQAFLNCSAMRVTTTFNVTADEDGLWIAQFPPVPASAHACVVAFTDVASTTSVWYLDIIFGTVLLCGGQSNMDIPLEYIVNGTTSERDSANAFSIIRLLQVPLQAYSSGAASTPLRDFAAIIPWTIANNVTTAGFSAECYLVARGLVEAARAADPTVDGVPVGAIQSDWPGDNIDDLSSAAALAQCNASAAEHAVTFPGPIPGPHYPSSQYNAMVAPLTVGPLAVSAFMYAQGEADVHSNSTTDIYECRLRALIADWRATLGAWPGAYFGITMLAPYSGDCESGGGCIGGVPAIRAAQLRVGLSTPNASVSVATDMGDPLAPAGSVHSRRKQAIAARIVAGAAAVLYGAASRAGPVYGPLYAAAADTSAAAGGVLTADVSFSPSSCPFGLQLVFGVNYTSTCPVGVSPTAPSLAECSWFAVRGAASGWLNATDVSVLNATAVRLSVPGVRDVAVATSFGQTSYPVTVLFSGSLPVAPWTETI